MVGLHSVQSPVKKLGPVACGAFPNTTAPQTSAASLPFGKGQSIVTKLEYAWGVYNGLAALAQTVGQSSYLRRRVYQRTRGGVVVK